MATDPPPLLTPAQLHALFDILNHNETYREVEGFKHSQNIRDYGYPFTTAETPPPDDRPTYAPESRSPLLQLLLTKCILTIPGMSTLPPDFWHTNFQGILANLADANLSESYDKGTLGTRKTLATGVSVIHEAVTRGLLAGVPEGPRIDLKKVKYDTTQAPELERAWDECVHEAVHGNLADELFEHWATTAHLEAHSPAVAAAVDYIIIHLASLLHHVFVGSPEGQYLLNLLENVYKLVPFSIVRQTLRIGNAATMLNGIIRVFLAKMGMGAVTNWFGITSGADDGMNLLQRIISMVLSWDAIEFRKQSTTLESANDHPPKSHLAVLKAYITLPRTAHDALREVSFTENKSIIAAILDASGDPALASASLTHAQHAHSLEWLSAALSARDRDEVTRAMCKSQPDHLTAAIRGFVGAYEPWIRAVHESLDLREHVTAIETFCADFIETSKPRATVVAAAKGGGWKVGGSKKSAAKKEGEDNSSGGRPPTVEDYVALLRRNKGLLFTFVHQFAKNCPTLRDMFRTWVHGLRSEFRPPQHAGAGGIDAKLQALYTSLPTEQQTGVLATVDAHAAYLAQLGALSALRMQRVLDQLALDAAAAAAAAVDDDDSNSKGRSSSKSSSCASLPSTASARPNMPGPGVYLMRWDALLDTTAITPAAAAGTVRCGQDVRGLRAGGKMGGVWDAGVVVREGERGVPVAPEGEVVLDMMGDGWRGLVNSIVAAGELGADGDGRGMGDVKEALKGVEASMVGPEKVGFSGGAQEVVLAV